MTFYNDNNGNGEPFVCAWLRELIGAGMISSGSVDDRSIEHIKPEDVRGHTRCHFFAGIGGWDYALRLAGWPEDRPVWTASLPCQPFSLAGKREGERDPRHLWPVFFDLVRECRPVTIFGEQVEAAIRIGWLDRIFADMETEGYTCGAVVLGAHSVGAPHIRQRVFWVADSQCVRLHRKTNDARAGGGDATPGGGRGTQSGGCGEAQQENRGLPDAPLRKDDERERSVMARAQQQGIGGDSAAGIGGVMGDAKRGGRCGIDGRGAGEVPEDRSVRLGNTDRPGRREQRRAVAIPAQQQTVERRGAWSDGQYILCADGKLRLVGRRLRLLDDGISVAMEPGGEPGYEIISPLAVSEVNRIGKLRGYGNAIIPQVAAEFVKAFMECER